MSKIPTESYKKIIDKVPILCVDALIEHQGKFLLIKRKNKPLKGHWFVPGGRVLKNETMEQALLRKVKEETGINVKIIGPLGYYEDFFKESDFDLKSGHHTVSVVFLTEALSLDIKLDNQSSGWRFSKNLPKQLKIKSFYEPNK